METTWCLKVKVKVKSAEDWIVAVLMKKIRHEPIEEDW